MARLVGVDLPRNKRMIVALTYIYGIGPTRSRKILELCKISEDLRTDDLTEDDIKKLRDAISKYTVEGDLKREEQLNIKRLSEINCYKGIRHRRKLPVNGQRTKTNARTRKGPRKTIANKKMAPQG